MEPNGFTEAPDEESKNKIDFDPKELRGPNRELMFGLMKGRKLQQFIGMAWKRGMSILNDPFLSANLSCMQASYY